MRLIKSFPFALALIFAAQTSAGCLDNPVVNQNKNPSTESSCAISFSAQDLCASVHWLREQTGDSTGEFELRFWKASQGTEFGPYVDPAEAVSVKLWMPSMNHGSAPVKVTRTGIGVYQAKNVSFVMPGKWEIWVHLKRNTAVVEKSKIDYEF